METVIMEATCEYMMYVCVRVCVYVCVSVNHIINMACYVKKQVKSI